MMQSMKHQIARIPLSIELYRALAAARARRVLSGREEHIYHGTNFYLPRFGGRSVVTIHDLSIFTHPQCHPATRVRFMHREVTLALRRATRLLTVSDFVRHELAAHFGLPLERIHSAPLAATDEFRPREESAVRALLGGLELEFQAFTLFVGTVEPRKNLVTLLDAYQSLPLQTRRRWPLVIAGHHGWGSERVHQRIAQGSSEGWVRYLGFLSAEQLPLLFASARLFTFPSLYEGFGLPVLEAMASGVPVICSDSSALPEVTGTAAVTHPSLDATALSGLIARGLEDDGWRSSQRAKGLARAAMFSWERCAALTADVYRTVAADP
jgi:alpha-1,3-rhamnosyl/mannosyltransferase